MKIFLSYASEDAAKAGEINAALTNEDHKVFFSGYDVRGAEGFDKKIRDHIDQCDLFIFLISPDSVKKGKYTITELNLAVERWENLSGYVLPVVLRETPRDAIPPPLLRLDFVEERGNLVADVAGEVAQIQKRRFGRRLSDATRRALVFGLGGLVIGAGLVALIPRVSCFFVDCSKMSRITLNCRKQPAAPQTQYEAEDAYVLVAGDFEPGVVEAQVNAIAEKERPTVVKEADVEKNEKNRFDAVIARLPGSSGGGDSRRWVLLKQAVEKPSQIVFPLPKVDPKQSAHFFVEIKSQAGAQTGLETDSRTGIRELANLVVQEDPKNAAGGAFGAKITEVAIELYEGEISCWRNVLQ
jgi:hypothetical protein